MAHDIQERDRQTGIEEAWHRKTNVVEKVDRENSMPWDVERKDIFYNNDEERAVQIPDQQILIATDDGLPVGQPFAPTYCPSTVKAFWKIVEESLDGLDYKVVSAGSISDRTKIFASIKINGGFNIGDREFKDYLTVVDSFDKSTTLQARYSNVCVVCANTFSSVLNSGKTVGKARHTPNLENHIKTLVESIKGFTAASEGTRDNFTLAENTPVSRDKARAWFAGIEGRNTQLMSNGLKQKVARLTELFTDGKGNSGRTLLDAFSALTEFHTHESSNRGGADSQYMSSEWGASAQLKSEIARTLHSSFETRVKKGTSLLEELAA